MSKQKVFLSTLLLIAATTKSPGQSSKIIVNPTGSYSTDFSFKRNANYPDFKVKQLTIDKIVIAYYDDFGPAILDTLKYSNNSAIYADKETGCILTFKFNNAGLTCSGYKDDCGLIGAHQSSPDGFFKKRNTKPPVISTE